MKDALYNEQIQKNHSGVPWEVKFQGLASAKNTETHTGKKSRLFQTEHMEIRHTRQSPLSFGRLVSANLCESTKPKYFCCQHFPAKKEKKATNQIFWSQVFLCFPLIS